MNARLRLEAELENLARMLPDWRAKMRCEEQFWPQFETLSAEIIARAEPEDRQYAQQRIQAMVAEHCK